VVVVAADRFVVYNVAVEDVRVHGISRGVTRVQSHHLCRGEGEGRCPLWVGAVVEVGLAALDDGRISLDGALLVLLVAFLMALLALLVAFLMALLALLVALFVLIVLIVVAALTKGHRFCTRTDFVSATPSAVTVFAVFEPRTKNHFIWVN